jgi:CelD/BcsL family acetyltransferase involved in cellulose biosynthesis
MTEITVRVCTQLADVPAVDWDALTAHPPASLTGSRTWIEAALMTVDRGLTPVLVAMHAADRLVGLMTLVLDEYQPEPVLRFAASPSNDLVDLMTLPGHEDAAGLAAIHALRALASKGWTVELVDIDPSGVLAKADPDRQMLDWGASSVAPTIDLRNSDACVSPRQAYRWDRSMRKLRTAHHVEFRCRAGADMVEVLDEFTALRDLRLRALGRSLCEPPLTLLDAVVRGLASEDHCLFMEMLVDETVVARDLYLLDGSVAMLWLRALDMGWLHHSCGHLLLRATIEQLGIQGYELLDLGRGDEPYKFGFGAQRRILLSARLPGVQPITAEPK